MSTEKQDSALELLMQLIALPSANPPGQEAALVEQLEARLGRLGIPCHRIDLGPGRCSLWAELPGREPGAFLLSGHLDTVAPSAAWTLPPWTPTFHGSRLYGLGACDMKAGVAMLVDGFEAARHWGTPRHTLRLLLSADEEDAYRGAASFAQAGLVQDARFVIVAEPSAGRVLLGERGAFWVRVHFTGREAHGSTPHQGINAILAATRFLTELERRMADGPALPYFGATTWNIGQIRGGRQPNIVAEHCEVELDFRHGGAPERERLAGLLDEVGAYATPPGGSFRWEVVNDLAACQVQPEAPLFQAFCEAHHQALGRPASIGVATYCTDLPVLAPPSGTPFVIYGPGDILQAHQPDEFVEVAAVEEGCQVFRTFLRQTLFDAP